MSRKVALALLAHPDDAELLCAGVLARLHGEQGYEIHIATCTPGDAGSATLGAEEIAAIRREEARAAAAVLGGAYHCLELRDFKVCYEPGAIARAIDLMRQVNPSLVLTHPRVDYMGDHEQCHLLARMASFSFAAPNASALPVPAGAQVPHLYYVDPLEGHDPYTGEAAGYTTLVDISEVMDIKQRMLECHASQRQWLRSHHGVDEYIDAMKRHAAARGEQAGVSYGEAFVQHRGHPYPQDDVLQALLGQVGAKS